jgi:hypothetical protein
MATYTDAIQKLYVAYFNRPADFAGLTYWQGVVDAAKGDTSAVSKAFAASDEYKKAYAGMDAYHVLNQVYINLFGHDADLAGLQFWGPKLQAGSITIDSVVTTVAAGAQGTDKVAFDSKVAAATAFTNQLDTAAEILGYSGDVANGMAKTWLTSVKDDATLKAAIADAALAATVNSITHPPVPGQTYVLSQGLDTLTGTSGNDTFNAFAFNNVSGANANTLQSVDSIDGGAGNDILNIEVKYDGTSANLNGGLAGTVKNVETINIDNSQADATLLTAAGAVDASLFSGATLINQIGKANSIKNVAAGTTAGFQGVVATAAAGLTVSANSTATSAAAALNGLKGAAATAGAEVDNQAVLKFDGAKLASVSVTGTLAKNDTAAGNKTANLDLFVTAGKDVQAVTVNSAVKTSLHVGNAAGSTKAVASVDASASAGAIKFDATGLTSLATIKTGAGADSITVNTTTAIDNPATDADDTVSAVVSAGAGNDLITVNTTGAGNTSIDAGDGSDEVDVAATAQNVTVNGGAGDDYLVFARGVGAKDVVNGGDGYDMLAIKGTSLIAQDYEILRAVVTNVEGLEFQDGITAADASKLAQFQEFDFDGASSINKVADAQSLWTWANLSATNAGYVQGSSASNATYAGSLHIDAFGGTAGAGAHVMVNAYTKDVVLNVNATAATSSAAGSASMVELTGDATTATVNLTNSVNAATTATATADVLATFVLNTGTGAVAAGGYHAGAYAADAKLTTLTLTGNGQAVVSNAASASVKLTTIDASGMTGVAAYDSTKQVGGLDFTGNDGLAETVKLGGGHDVVRTASTYQNMDTISGLKIVGNADGSLNTAKSDMIVTGVTTFAKTTVTGATLGLALTDAASKAGNNLVFTYNGDTYVFIDNATTTIDASNTVGTFGSDDVVIKLVGSYDLDLLVLNLNSVAAPVPTV